MQQLGQVVELEEYACSSEQTMKIQSPQDDGTPLPAPLQLVILASGSKANSMSSGASAPGSVLNGDGAGSEGPRVAPGNMLEPESEFANACRLSSGLTLQLAACSRRGLDLPKAPRLLRGFFQALRSDSSCLGR